MPVALPRVRSYLGMRLGGPFPLLLLAGLNAGSAFGALMSPLSDVDTYVFIGSGRALTVGASAYTPTINNLNAPASLPFFHLLAVIAPPWVLPAWYLVSLAAYLLSLLILARMYPHMADRVRLAWALAQSGIWSLLSFGQVYAFLLLPLLLGYAAALKGRLLAAGLLAGLTIAFKPNLLALPAVLWLAGYRRVALALCTGAAGWSLLPVLLYGPEPYAQWLAVVQFRLLHELSLPSNSSVDSLAFRLGIPWMGPPASLALLALVGLWAWRVRPGMMQAASAGILAGILAAPVAWIGYICFALPAFFERPWNRLVQVSAILLVAVPLWPAEFFGLPYVYLHTTANTLAYACLLLGLALPLRRPPT